MLVYYFVPFIVSNRYLLFWVSNGHNSVTVQNRTHVYMNFFDNKDLGNHLLQLCPKVVKHPVYKKWSHYKPSVTQRVGRGIHLLFHDNGTRRGWEVSSMPWPHFTPRKDPVPILQEAGWAPGPVWMGGKSIPTGIRFRTDIYICICIHRHTHQNNVGKTSNKEIQIFSLYWFIPIFDKINVSQRCWKI